MMTTRFAAYGSEVIGEGHTLAQLIEFQKSEGTLFARAENSGCEGCYCEVARWNLKTHRWERFAFLKCFGGEWVDGITSASKTAAKFAEAINSAGHCGLSIVHVMPEYSGDRSLVALS
jgi:hypothetical protein